MNKQSQKSNLCAMPWLSGALEWHAKANDLLNTTAEIIKA
jgi:hypothetical protein